MSETDLLLRTEGRKVQIVAESSVSDEHYTDHANSEAGRNGEESALRKAYQEHFDETAGFPWLMSEDPAGRDQLKEIRELLIDTCCSRRKEIMIGGELIRAEQVVRTMYARAWMARAVGLTTSGSSGGSGPSSMKKPT